MSSEGRGQQAGQRTVPVGTYAKDTVDQIDQIVVKLMTYVQF